MKGFKFRMQTALNLRERKEEQLRIEAAQIAERYRHENEVLETMIAEREAALHESSTGRVGRLNPEDVWMREHHLTVMDERISQQRYLLTVVAQELQAKKGELLVASQETQALEKLKEQHLEQFRKDALFEEQKFLDELASIRSARQQRDSA